MTISKKIIPYILAGYPDLKTTEILLRQCYASGLIFIELGIPFSDPSADGPVIQAAAAVASRSFNFAALYVLLLQLKKEGISFEFTLMTYTNPLFVAGFERTLSLFKDVGVKGLLLPDMPFEEHHFIRGHLPKNDEIKLVWMISENLSKDELAKIVSHSDYYVYLVSYLGTTGRSVRDLESIRRVIAWVKNQGDLPVMVGFGIQSKSDAKAILQYADGAIIGTQIIRQLDLGIDKACHFLRTLV
jgi:tryptophan synthase alpha chain